jgi:hypothetical protein
MVAMIKSFSWNGLLSKVLKQQPLVKFQNLILPSYEAETISFGFCIPIKLHTEPL